MHDTAPRELRSLLRMHNLAVLLASLLSLCAAVGTWVLLYYLGMGAVLAGRTFVQGEDAGIPSTYGFWFSGVLILTLLGSFGWRLFHPPGKLRDRSIIGWHVIPEVLLLPASLILAFTDNLSAYRRIRTDRLRASWELLKEMLTRGKLITRKVPQLGIDEELVQESLLDLQYAGLIDLHEGREEWFYRIRGTEEDRVKKWNA
jgi:hypothetical protein